MRKNYVIVYLVFVFNLSLLAQKPEFTLAGNRITTDWAGKVNPMNPLPEYPRPQLVRDSWKNLNGLWDYAITPKESTIPGKYDGKILVPFAIESALSGVMKNVGADNELWYSTVFTINPDMRGKRIILHFGAVDWECKVSVNGKQAGSHSGGYGRR